MKEGRLETRDLTLTLSHVIHPGIRYSTDAPAAFSIIFLFEERASERFDGAAVWQQQENQTDRMMVVKGIAGKRQACALTLLWTEHTDLLPRSLCALKGKKTFN